MVQEWVQGSMGIFSCILTEIRTLKIQGQHIVEWPISWKNLCSRRCEIVQGKATECRSRSRSGRK